MNILTTLIAGIVVVSGWLSGLVGTPNLGATIITTNLSDTINVFRTNVNTSLTNINTDLVAVSTTIATYGNIVTHSFPIIYSEGGTGLTAAPTAGQLLIGNGSGYTLGVLTASGTKTHIYNTNGAIAISSDEVDPAGTYSWSGPHTFSGGVTSTAAVIFTGSLDVSGTATFTGSTIVPTPTLSTQAATKGYVDTSSAAAGWYLLGSSTISGVSSTTVSFSSTTEIMIVAVANFSNGSDVPALQFNGDTGNNYNSAAGACNLTAAGSGVYYFNGIFTGTAALAKYGVLTLNDFDAASPVLVSCTWSNTTAAFRSVKMLNSAAANALGAGSYIKVYGRN